MTHFSVQGNHIHLLAEAVDRKAMSNGLRALFIRIAKQLNAMMGVQGPRFVDRYHERRLTSPTQARNALRYVLQNHALHLEKMGKRAPEHDEFTSAAHPALATKPASWLLRVGAVRSPP